MPDEASGRWVGAGSGRPHVTNGWFPGSSFRRNPGLSGAVNSEVRDATE